MAGKESLYGKVNYKIFSSQDFETAHGSDGGVSEVKNAAQRYLESRGGSADPEPSWSIMQDNKFLMLRNGGLYSVWDGE